MSPPSVKCTLALTTVTVLLLVSSYVRALDNIKVITANASSNKSPADVTSSPAINVQLHKTTLAPVNAIAAAAINDAFKSTGALAHVANAAAAVAGTPAPVVAIKSLSTHSSLAAANVTVTTKLPGVGPAISVAANVNSTSAPHLAASSSIAAVTTHAPKAVNRKLDQYFDPICKQLDKLQPKQMFKIQSQLKKFVELTNGKMSVCFAQQYAIDPSLILVTKPQLLQICESRKEPSSSTKVQFKTFESCAIQNWEANLDKELDKISEARAKNHQHSKGDPRISMTHDDDDDEVSVIGDVVNTVLGSSESNKLVSKSDIKLINIGGPSEPPASLKPSIAPVKTTVSPTIVAATTKAAAATTTSPPSALHPLATAVAHANHSVTTTTAPIATSARPAAVSPVPVAATIMPTPAIVKSSITTAASVAPASTIAPSAKPTAAAAVHVTINPASPAANTAVPAAPRASISASPKPTTVKPNATIAVADNKVSTTSSPTETVGDKKIMNDPNMVVVFVDEPGKAQAEGAHSTPAPAPAGPSTPVPTSHKITSTAPTTTTTAPTSKSPSLVDKLLSSAGIKSPGSTTVEPKAHPSTSSKPAIDIKVHSDSTSAPSASSTTSTKAPATTTAAANDKDGQKKKDEQDAKKAIEALKKQRANGHGSPADERMHQIEHERQMSIDPVGHTIKHKIYEMKKAGMKP